jgi:hypothetical protein
MLAHLMVPTNMSTVQPLFDKWPAEAGGWGFRA